ncbi:interaptin-like isoform X2 [Iris pallida]|uniref:Interaptin-like isoform X2 n=1 Tax=Iris pallida TaxID=29817 RepID=A0AAX6IB64_IRIPA|nr:interaptin-like isoform X2 [Iris pallida]
MDRVFKSHRYKSDRSAERVGFKFSSLQAFQVPPGCDRLQLSIISVETGKAITKPIKTAVRSGTCQWTESLSESILIPQNDASKELEECLIRIVLSSGSHRSGALGEVTLNLTEYISTRDSGLLPLPLEKCAHQTILQVRIECLNTKTRFRDERHSRETSHLVGSHTNNDDTDSKSDISDSMFNQSVASSSSNHFGVSYPEEPVHRDTSLSASGSHRSSDSGESSIGRLNFSPRNVSNGGPYVGRQDSAGSHNNGTHNVGPADDSSRSNPSSFNSRTSGSSTPNRWQESAVRTSSHGLASISLRPPNSPKDFIEAAEETIEELQDEAKMWERHAQKLKIDLQKLKKECLDKSKHQAELDVELSAAYSECDSLKKEVEQLKSSLKEKMTKQSVSETSKIEDLLQVQKELEDEVKFQKESNANLSLQLRKTQEANTEFVSIIEELEETIEKQRLDISNNLQESPVSETERDMRSPMLSDIEAEWASKRSAKDEEITKLDETVAGFIAQQPSKTVSDQGHHDLIEEIEDLRAKVQELERDCAELTEENLELMYKMKVSGKNTKGGDYHDSGSEISLLRSQICQLEEELRRKEMLKEGLTETLTFQIKNLEKKCADLELELLYFKDQACDLHTKLSKCQADVEDKTIELIELQQKFESSEVADVKGITAVYERKDLSDEDQEQASKIKVDYESDLEELKAVFSLKEKEVDVLNRTKEELEDMIIDIQREKSQLEEDLASAVRESNITSKRLEDVQHELMLLTSSVDSQVSSNKILERNLMELENCKHELETHISDIEEENVQLSERISGLEAQLRYLTNEKESNRLELEDSNSLVTDLKNEVAQQQAEMELQRGELKQKLQEAHKRFSEAQEEIEYLKRSHPKLQSTIESLIEENSSLQKSNGDLRRQKLELHERSAYLEVKLSESQKMNSKYMMEIESLELKISSLQKGIASKERSLISQIESMFQEHKEQEEKINQTRIMLRQIDLEKTVEVENLKREMATISLQVSATHDERERMASDALREVSSLRSDKSRLENSLQDAHAKVKLHETELQTLRQETGKKVKGLVDLLNASKQSEEMLISDKEHMQRQTEVAKSSEEKCKKTVSELELKLKAADYEKQQIIEETSSMKVQLQRMAHLQDEIVALKSSLEVAKFESGKLEESLQMVSGECECLKTERVLLTERISNMQKGLHDGDDDRRSRIALEEKLLRLEGDLTTKEASCAHEAELKNEVNQIKRANSEYQRKIQCLEEENDKLTRKAQVLEKELILQKEDIQDNKFKKKNALEIPRTQHNEVEIQTQEVLNSGKDVSVNKIKILGDSRLQDMEAEIQELHAKIRILEAELADALVKNSMYRTQLEGYLAGKQSSESEGFKKSVPEHDTMFHQASKVASLEAELKDMKHQASKVASLEAELKDMKERYLHISLQYAEVEAERGELVMKLKAMSKAKKWFS